MFQTLRESEKDMRVMTIIPISSALVGIGMGLGTVLALIIGGAGASIPELIILGSMFKKKLVFAFALNVFLVAIVAGLSGRMFGTLMAEPVGKCA